MKLLQALALMAAFLLPHPAFAGTPAPDEAVNATAPLKAERAVTTNHVLELGDAGGQLTYTVEAGELLIPMDETPKAEAKAAARMFYVAYTVNATEPRPLTFAFNGGPGSASVWLHLGAMGPRRVVLEPDGRVPPPPVRLADNLETWLPFTDMVFIDPVGTGFSRAEPRDKQAEGYWGVEQDLNSVARFIRDFLSRENRWLSPLFLVGESYGTTRAAALASKLQLDMGVALNGVVLVSPVLEMETITFDEGRLLPYALFLPTYAAAARWHDKLSGDADLETTLKQAEAFSLDRYLPALAKGADLPEDERESLYRDFAGLTGLNLDLVRAQRARVPGFVFFKELLRDRGLIIGRMDATITGIDPEPETPYPGYDPSLERLYAVFGPAMNAYARTELGFSSELPYEYLNNEVGSRWDWSTGLPRGQGYVGMAARLREAMSVNPHLRVRFVCGYYDLATPYFAAMHTVRQMGLDPRLRDHLDMRFYEAGHMLYTHDNVRRRLTRDMAQWYQVGRQSGNVNE